MKSVVVGTAGHIDHGKSALVKALTGTDPDRLEEEKRRGITIDIGFAHLELAPPGGEALRLGFVDVPGHERFVRNMLAGVGGIDLVLLVIAADESIKPQTREHFDICRLLGIRRGITVLTKSDLVDRDTLEVVRLEVEDFLRGSFLEGAPILAISSKSGAGLEELKQALAHTAGEVKQRDTSALARLPVDRVFVMKGFGTVVTGTLLAGTITKEEELEVFPGQRRVRVRGVQVHGQAAERATAGQRTALNLAGVSKEELARGMMLAPPNTFRTTSRADVSVALLPSARPLKDRARVHLHAYTAETVAEVVLHGPKQLVPGQSGYAQLRTAEPMLLIPGDRFILRQFSPVLTIGGGTVLDATPMAGQGAKESAESQLGVLAKDLTQEILATRVVRRGKAGLMLSDAVAETGWRRSQVEAQAATLKGKLLRFGDVLIAQGAFTQAQREALGAVEEFHGANPLVAGISKEELREKLGLRAEVFSAVLEELLREKRLAVAGEQVRSAGRTLVFKDEEAQSKRVIEQAFFGAGLKVPALKDVLAGLRVDKATAQKIVTLLLRDKVLVKISDDLVFHHSALEELRQRVSAYKAKSAKIGVAEFKDLTGVSRKYAIPLLEYLDRERVTRRVGDHREIL
ncbi:MAG TPA: selenocysteine-specific translation elongation factor [Terriglobales bacterium]|nr:selenocysteine-specific translation elongation factor [Terriglobales bacterium]